MLYYLVAILYVLACFLLLLVVGLGVYPAPLLNLIQGMVRGLY